MTLIDISTIIFFITLAVIIIIDKISRLRITIYSVIIGILLIVITLAHAAVEIQWEVSFGVDQIIFFLFLTYTMIPLSLRYSTLLGVVGSCLHVLVSSLSAINGRLSPDIIARQVSLS